MLEVEPFQPGDGQEYDDGGNIYQCVGVYEVTLSVPYLETRDDPAGVTERQQ